MSKMTLLEITQNILSSMDSDEVNSISDTVESLQVAEVVRETYNELFSNIDIPELKVLVKLDGLSDPDHPNYLQIPDNVKEVFWIKYDAQTNGQTDYVTVEYLPPENFVHMLIKRLGQSNFTEIEDLNSGVRLNIFNNKNPKFWTTFDDKNLCFDSWNQSLDTTLQQSKSMAWAQLDPVFEMSDLFVPIIDTNLFPLLLSEAKQACFVNFKQVSNSKEQERSHRQRIRAQNDMWRADQRRPYNRTPDYGRRPR